MFCRKFKLFLSIFVLLLAALACGGSDPVTLADIPVIEGAVEMEAGGSTMADTVVEALKQSAGQEGVTTETAIYGVPSGTTWDTVKSFYATDLGSDWTEDSQLSQSQEGFSSSGWTRGGGLSSEQAVVVALVTDPFAGQDFMILVVFSE